MEKQHDPNDPELRNVLRQTLTAWDDDNRFWSKEEVSRARELFRRKGGDIPSYGALCQAFGKERLDAVLDNIMGERAFHLKLLAADDPCHSCGATENLKFFDFGLARVVEQKRDWKVTAATAAISAVTLPLFGVGRLYGPSKTTRGHLLRARLVLCPSCVNMRAGLFGGFTPKEMHCTIHPAWNELHDAGFTRFVPGDELSNWS